MVGGSGGGVVQATVHRHSLWIAGMVLGGGGKHMID